MTTTNRMTRTATVTINQSNNMPFQMIQIKCLPLNLYRKELPKHIHSNLVQSKPLQNTQLVAVRLMVTMFTMVAVLVVLTLVKTTWVHRNRITATHLPIKWMLTCQWVPSKQSHRAIPLTCITQCPWNTPTVSMPIERIYRLMANTITKSKSPSATNCPKKRKNNRRERTDRVFHQLIKHFGFWRWRAQSHRVCCI